MGRYERGKLKYCVLSGTTHIVHLEHKYSVLSQMSEEHWHKCTLTLKALNINSYFVFFGIKSIEGICF